MLDSGHEYCLDEGEVLDSGRNAVLNVIKSDSNMYRYAYARKTNVGWYIASVCKAKNKPLVMQMQMQKRGTNAALKMTYQPAIVGSEIMFQLQERQSKSTPKQQEQSCRQL